MWYRSWGKVIIITTGGGEAWIDGVCRIAKVEFVSGLNVALQTQLLKTANALPLVPEFTQELQGFELNLPPLNPRVIDGGTLELGFTLRVRHGPCRKKLPTH